MPLSQLGAQSSRLSPVTGTKSLLPVPASFPQAAATYYPLLVRRNRFSLVFGSIISSFSIYFLLLRGQVGSKLSHFDSSSYLVAPPIDASGDGSGKLYSSFRSAENALDVSAPEELPVRVLPPEHPHPPLPRSLAFTDPWPDAPDIASFWLCDERIYEKVADIIPMWPKTSNTRPQSLQEISKVSWKELYRPIDYEGPIKLEALPQTERYKVWPKIQKESFEDPDITLRDARREWVKKAFLHAWRGYKLVASHIMHFEGNV